MPSLHRTAPRSSLSFASITRFFGPTGLRRETFAPRAKSLLAMSAYGILGWSAAACGSSEASSPAPGPAATTAPAPDVAAPSTTPPRSTSSPANPSPVPPIPEAPESDAGTAPEVPAEPADDPPCDEAGLWKPGTEQTVTLTHDGRSRSYLVHVGKSVVVRDRTPLVVNIHGLNNSPQIQVMFSGMNALSDTKGFIVVYPQGISASFNAGACCGTATQQSIDDLGFIRALVADVSKRSCVDRRRVYATGFSNGGYMSHRLGCEASDLFAAIAPVAGAEAVATCTPKRPVPVIAFHGMSDSIVSYRDGKAMAEGWAKRDGCTAAAARTSFGSSYCDEWTQCEGDVAVKLCSVAGWNHLWPGNGTAIPASAAIWAFFERYKLP